MNQPGSVIYIWSWWLHWMVNMSSISGHRIFNIISLKFKFRNRGIGSGLSIYNNCTLRFCGTCNASLTGRFYGLILIMTKNKGTICTRFNIFGYVLVQSLWMWLSEISLGVLCSPRLILDVPLSCLMYSFLNTCFVFCPIFRKFLNYRCKTTNSEI